MSDKLWLVQLHFDMVVRCKKEEIRYIVEDHAGHELENDATYSRGVHVSKIKKLSDVPKSWRNAIPWDGDHDYCQGDPDRTVKKLLSKKKKKRHDAMKGE